MPKIMLVILAAAFMASPAWAKRPVVEPPPPAPIQVVDSLGMVVGEFVARMPNHETREGEVWSGDGVLIRLWDGSERVHYFGLRTGSLHAWGQLMSFDPEFCTEPLYTKITPDNFFNTGAARFLNGDLWYVIEDTPFLEVVTGSEWLGDNCNDSVAGSTQQEKLGFQQMENLGPTGFTPPFRLQ